MHWPLMYLLVVLGVGLAAIVAPWLIPASRRGLLAGVVPPLAATLVWICYERHLHSIAPPVDPLIRVDLFAIVPVILLDWCAALGAIAWSRRSCRQN